MKLSAPVYRLKRAAKLLSRESKIPLHEALNRIATQEGFGAWSLLVRQISAAMPHKKLFKELKHGDLVLIGARPGEGKTQLSLKLAVEAMKAGRYSLFFSLEFTERDLADCFRSIDVDPAAINDHFTFDSSANVSADYIVRQMDGYPPGTLAVIDYLQILDQKREHPDLMTQVQMLKDVAAQRGLIFVFISQIDRSYDPAKKPFPGIEDVRLPNPLDLGLFSKACFLNNGQMRFGGVRPSPPSAASD
jgi:hypothetical protein